MGQAAIESFIHQATGLSTQMMGSGVITNAINRRCRSLHLAPSDYWAYLQQHLPEQQALIETVVIPETWFFRDRTPFQYLSHHVQTLLQEQPKRSPMRILSMPCSTGEEPYSIVMALLKAGIPVDRFSVDAFDISHYNIQSAEGGSYGQFSFRHGDPSMKARFFTAQGDRYEIHRTVKNAVRFRVANILKSHTWQPPHPYDVIFCRNLLIYFDDANRKKVLTAVQKALHPEGLLFVGHAESGVLLNQKWRSLRIPFTFAYQIPRIITAPVAAPVGVKPEARPTLKHPEKTSTKVEIPTPPPVLTTPETPRMIDAQTLANAGQLDHAATLCHQILNLQPLQFETHLLLGEIHQAQNQNQLAEQWFTKALYLDPTSVIALTYLQRLLRERGDWLQADRLQARIQRL